MRRRELPRTSSIDSRYDLAHLRTFLRPFRLHWLPTVGSTSSHAAILRRQGTLYAPAVVLTGRQTAGRGRGSNLWWSPRGCITATFVWPIDEQLQPQQIPLIVGVAVRRAAVELTGDESIELKWPNDLLHRDRKLAGILCERIDRCDLIGIGLNACPEWDLVESDESPRLTAPRAALDSRRTRPARGAAKRPDGAMPRGLRDRVTSLSAIARREIGVTATLISISQHLHQLLSRPDERNFPKLLGEYDRHHALIGRTVSIVVSPGDPAITGEVKGLDDAGRLLLKTRGGVERILSGQVNLHER